MTRPITSHIIEYDPVQNVIFTVNIVIYGVRCLQGNNSNNFKENTRYNIEQNDFTDNINQCIILWKNVPKKGMLFYKRSITLLLDYTYLELDKFLHDLSLEKILNYKRYIYMIIIIFTNVCPFSELCCVQKSDNRFSTRAHGFCDMECQCTI